MTTPFERFKKEISQLPHNQTGNKFISEYEQLADGTDKVLKEKQARERREKRYMSFE